MGSVIRYQPSVDVSAPRVNPTSGIGEGLQQAGRDVQTGLANLGQAAWFLQRQESATEKLKLNAAAEIEQAKFLGDLAARENEIDLRSRETDNYVDFKPTVNKLYDTYPSEFREYLASKYENPDTIFNLTMDKVGTKFAEGRIGIAKKDTALAVHINKKLYKSDVANLTSNALGDEEEVIAGLQAIDTRGAQLINNLSLEPDKHAQVLSELVGKISDARFMNDLVTDPLSALSRQRSFAQRVSAFIVPETLKQLKEGVLKGPEEFQKHAKRVVENYAENTNGALPDADYDSFARQVGVDLSIIRDHVAKVRNRTFTAIGNQLSAERRAIETKSEGTVRGLMSELFHMAAANTYTGSVLVTKSMSLIDAKRSDLTSDDLSKVRAFSDALSNSQENDVDDTVAEAGIKKMIRLSPRDASLPLTIAKASVTKATRRRLFDAYEQKQTVLDNEEKALLHEALTKGMHRFEDTLNVFPKGRADEAVNEGYWRIYRVLQDGDKPGATPEVKMAYRQYKNDPQAFVLQELRKQQRITKSLVLGDGREQYEKYKANGYDIRSLAQLHAMAKVGMFDMVTNVGQDNFKALTMFVEQMDPVVLPEVAQSQSEADSLLKQEKKDGATEFKRRGK